MSGRNGKYAALGELLAAATARGERSLTLDFGEIEQLVDGLPSAAYTQRRWWSGGQLGNVVSNAGWRVEAVGFAMRRVAFVRQD
jgi:hypothetical protein